MGAPGPIGSDTGRSAVVHALTYSLIFRVMHELTLSQAAVLVVVVLAVLFTALWIQMMRQAL